MDTRGPLGHRCIPAGFEDSVIESLCIHHFPRRSVSRHSSPSVEVQLSSSRQARPPKRGHQAPSAQPSPYQDQTLLCADLAAQVPPQHAYYEDPLGRECQASADAVVGSRGRLLGCLSFLVRVWGDGGRSRRCRGCGGSCGCRQHTLRAEAQGSHGCARAAGTRQ